MQNEKNPALASIWETAEQIKGHDETTEATSPIDRDQAIDEYTGNTNYDSYILTIGNGNLHL